MALKFAFVTLLTSNSYLPGALTLVGALKDVHPSPPVHPEVDFQTVCLVTPETVDVTTIKLLRKAFNVVIGVELIVQKDEKRLQLLGKYTNSRQISFSRCRVDHSCTWYDYECSSGRIGTWFAGTLLTLFAELFPLRVFICNSKFPSHS